MRKNLFFFTFLFNICIFFYLQAEENSQTGLTTCDIEISEKAIINFDVLKIDLVKIEVKNYRKWSKNNINIITSPGRHILEKYKKRFKSKITFIFSNGSKCFFSAKIRQSGDEKDHITLHENSVIQSLDVQLLDGNIRGITKFKLFKSKSRGNHQDEIIQTQLLRNLGFLAPRSINLKVEHNGIKTEMLLQEKAAKELLEYNNRREGPILEGDEKFFWKIAENIPNDNRSNWDVGLPFLLNKSVKTMLAKSTNSKLIYRSNQHMQMTLRSINNLNQIYLYWGNRFQDEKNNFFYFDYDLDNTLLSMFDETNLTKLEVYNFLMQATNSQHGLVVPNRKFYWNSIENYYEPINYDSNPEIDLYAPTTTGSMPRLPVSKSYLNSINFLSEQLVNINIETLHQQINNSGLNMSKERLIKKIDKIRLNLSRIKDNYLNSISSELVLYNSYKNIEDVFFNFNKSLQEIDPDAYIVIKNIDENNFYRCKIYFKNCEKYKIKKNNISKLLEGELKIKNKNYQYVGTNINIDQFKNERQYNLKKFLDSNIYYENNVDVKINIDNRIIDIIQKKEGAKVFIINGLLEDIQINYQGININKFSNENSNLDNPSNYPINTEGLTGCLSLVNMNVDNINISANNSSCEDTINLINVNGNINNIKINNSFSDALDVDFSDLSINKIEILKSGNDCTDFSAGTYGLNSLILKYCGDKGISIGEKSNVKINNIDVDNAILGVASKDSSITKIKKANINKVETCAASYNKKQEFFGSIIRIDKLTCANYKNFTEEDKISKIYIKE